VWLEKRHGSVKATIMHRKMWASFITAMLQFSGSIIAEDKENKVLIQ
jgi:hypothetical protein